MRKLQLLLIVAIFTCIKLNSQSKETITAVETERKKMQLLVAKDSISRIADFYSEDAYVNGYDFKSNNKLSIIDYWKSVRGKGVQWGWKILSRSGNSDIVFETGISYLTLQYTKNKKTYKSIFSVVWEKQSNGKFKICSDYYRPYNN